MCGMPDINWGSVLGAAAGAGVAALAPKQDFSAAIAASNQSTSAALAALQAQNEALKKASALTTPAADSEAAMQAADRLRRKTSNRRSTTVAGEDLAPANVAVKYLTGE